MRINRFTARIMISAADFLAHRNPLFSTATPYRPGPSLRSRHCSIGSHTARQKPPRRHSVETSLQFEPSSPPVAPTPSLRISDGPTRPYAASPGSMSSPWGDVEYHIETPAQFWDGKISSLPSVKQRPWTPNGWHRRALDTDLFLAFLSLRVGRHSPTTQKTDTRATRC